MTRARRLDQIRLAGVWRAYDYIVDFNPQAAQRMADALFAAGDTWSISRTVGGWCRNDLARMDCQSAHTSSLPYAGNDIVIQRVRHSAQRQTNP